MILDESELISGNKRYRAFHKDVQKCLTTLEKTGLSEWSTLNSGLASLQKVLYSAKEIHDIPDKLHFFAVLSRCMEPSAQMGVHRKAVETLGIACGKLTQTTMCEYLPLFTMHLFSLLQSSANQIRPEILSIIEKDVASLPLWGLRPALPGLLGALLGSYTEKDLFAKTRKILDHIRNRFDRLDGVSAADGGGANAGGSTKNNSATAADGASAAAAGGIYSGADGDAAADEALMGLLPPSPPAHRVSTRFGVPSDASDEAKRFAYRSAFHVALWSVIRNAPAVRSAGVQYLRTYLPKAPLAEDDGCGSSEEDEEDDEEGEEDATGNNNANAKSSSNKADGATAAKEVMFPPCPSVIDEMYWGKEHTHVAAIVAALRSPQQETQKQALDLLLYHFPLREEGPLGRGDKIAIVRAALEVLVTHQNTTMRRVLMWLYGTDSINERYFREVSAPFVIAALTEMFGEIASFTHAQAAAQRRYAALLSLQQYQQQRHRQRAVLGQQAAASTLVSSSALYVSQSPSPPSAAGVGAGGDFASSCGSGAASAAHVDFLSAVLAAPAAAAYFAPLTQAEMGLLAAADTSDKVLVFEIFIALINRPTEKEQFLLDVLMPSVLPYVCDIFELRTVAAEGYFSASQVAADITARLEGAAVSNFANATKNNTNARGGAVGGNGRASSSAANGSGGAPILCPTPPLLTLPPPTPIYSPQALRGLHMLHERIPWAPFLRRMEAKLQSLFIVGGGDADDEGAAIPASGLLPSGEVGAAISRILAVAEGRIFGGGAAGAAIANINADMEGLRAAAAASATPPPPPQPIVLINSPAAIYATLESVKIVLDATKTVYLATAGAAGAHSLSQRENAAAASAAARRSIAKHRRSLRVRGGGEGGGGVGATDSASDAESADASSDGDDDDADSISLFIPPEAEECLDIITRLCDLLARIMTALLTPPAQPPTVAASQSPAAETESDAAAASSGDCAPPAGPSAFFVSSADSGALGLGVASATTSAALASLPQLALDVFKAAFFGIFCGLASHVGAPAMVALARREQKRLLKQTKNGTTTASKEEGGEADAAPHPAALRAVALSGRLYARFADAFGAAAMAYLYTMGSGASSSSSALAPVRSDAAVFGAAKAPIFRRFIADASDALHAILQHYHQTCRQYQLGHLFAIGGTKADAKSAAVVASTTPSASLATTTTSTLAAAEMLEAIFAHKPLWSRLATALLVFAAPTVAVCAAQLLTELVVCEAFRRSLRARYKAKQRARQVRDRRRHGGGSEGAEDGLGRGGSPARGGGADNVVGASPHRSPQSPGSSNSLGAERRPTSASTTPRESRSRSTSYTKNNNNNNTNTNANSNKDLTGASPGDSEGIKAAASATAEAATSLLRAILSRLWPMLTPGHTDLHAPIARLFVKCYMHPLSRAIADEVMTGTTTIAAANGDGSNSSGSAEQQHQQQQMMMMMNDSHFAVLFRTVCLLDEGVFGTAASAGAPAAPPTTALLAAGGNAASPSAQSSLLQPLLPSAPSHLALQMSPDQLQLLFYPALRSLLGGLSPSNNNGGGNTSNSNKSGTNAYVLGGLSGDADAVLLQRRHAMADFVDASLPFMRRIVDPLLYKLLQVDLSPSRNGAVADAAEAENEDENALSSAEERWRLNFRRNAREFIETLRGILAANGRSVAASLLTLPAAPWTCRLTEVLEAKDFFSKTSSSSPNAAAEKKVSSSSSAASPSAALFTEFFSEADTSDDDGGDDDWASDKRRVLLHQIPYLYPTTTRPATEGEADASATVGQRNAAATNGARRRRTTLTNAASNTADDDFPRTTTFGVIAYVLLRIVRGGGVGSFPSSAASGSAAPSSSASAPSLSCAKSEGSGAAVASEFAFIAGLSPHRSQQQQQQSSIGGRDPIHRAEADPLALAAATLLTELMGLATAVATAAQTQIVVGQLLAPSSAAGGGVGVVGGNAAASPSGGPSVSSPICDAAGGSSAGGAGVGMFASLSHNNCVGVGGASIVGLVSSSHNPLVASFAHGAAGAGGAGGLPNASMAGASAGVFTQISLSTEGDGWVDTVASSSLNGAATAAAAAPALSLIADPASNAASFAALSAYLSSSAAVVLLVSLVASHTAKAAIDLLYGSAIPYGSVHAAAAMTTSRSSASASFSSSASHNSSALQVVLMDLFRVSVGFVTSLPSGGSSSSSSGNNVNSSSPSSSAAASVAPPPHDGGRAVLTAAVHNSFGLWGLGSNPRRAVTGSVNGNASTAVSYQSASAMTEEASRRRAAKETPPPPMAAANNADYSATTGGDDVDAALTDNTVGASAHFTATANAKGDGEEYRYSGDYSSAAVAEAAVVAVDVTSVFDTLMFHRTLEYGLAAAVASELGSPSSFSPSSLSPANGLFSRWAAFVATLLPLLHGALSTTTQHLLATYGRLLGALQSPATARGLLNIGGSASCDEKITAAGSEESTDYGGAAAADRAYSGDDFSINSSEDGDVTPMLLATVSGKVLAALTDLTVYLFTAHAAGEALQRAVSGGVAQQQQLQQALHQQRVSQSHGWSGASLYGSGGGGGIFGNGNNSGNNGGAGGNSGGGSSVSTKLASVGGALLILPNAIIGAAAAGVSAASGGGNNSGNTAAGAGGGGNAGGGLFPLPPAAYLNAAAAGGAVAMDAAAFASAQAELRWALSTQLLAAVFGSLVGGCESLEQQLSAEAAGHAAFASGGGGDTRAALAAARAAFFLRHQSFLSVLLRFLGPEAFEQIVWQWQRQNSSQFMSRYNALAVNASGGGGGGGGGVEGSSTTSSAATAGGATVPQTADVASLFTGADGGGSGIGLNGIGVGTSALPSFLEELYGGAQQCGRSPPFATALHSHWGNLGVSAAGTAGAGGEVSANAAAMAAMASPHGAASGLGTVPSGGGATSSEGYIGGSGGPFFAGGSGGSANGGLSGHFGGAGGSAAAAVPPSVACAVGGGAAPSAASAVGPSPKLEAERWAGSSSSSRFNGIVIEMLSSLLSASQVVELGQMLLQQIRSGGGGGGGGNAGGKTRGGGGGGGAAGNVNVALSSTSAYSSNGLAASSAGGGSAVGPLNVLPYDAAFMHLLTVFLLKGQRNPELWGASSASSSASSVGALQSSVIECISSHVASASTSMVTSGGGSGLLMGLPMGGGGGAGGGSGGGSASGGSGAATTVASTAGACSFVFLPMAVMALEVLHHRHTSAWLLLQTHHTALSRSAATAAAARGGQQQQQQQQQTVLPLPPLVDILRDRRVTNIFIRIMEVLIPHTTSDVAVPTGAAAAAGQGSASAPAVASVFSGAFAAAAATMAPLRPSAASSASGAGAASATAADAPTSTSPPSSAVAYSVAGGVDFTGAMATLHTHLACSAVASGAAAAVPTSVSSSSRGAGSANASVLLPPSAVAASTSAAAALHPLIALLFVGVHMSSLFFGALRATAAEAAAAGGGGASAGAGGPNASTSTGAASSAGGANNGGASGSGGGAAGGNAANQSGGADGDATTNAVFTIGGVEGKAVDQLCALVGRYLFPSIKAANDLRDADTAAVVAASRTEIVLALLTRFAELGDTVQRRIRSDAIDLFFSESFFRTSRGAIGRWRQLLAILSRDRAVTKEVLHRMAGTAIAKTAGVFASMVTSAEAEALTRAKMLRRLAFYSFCNTSIDVPFIMAVKERLTDTFRNYQKVGRQIPIRAALFVFRVLMTRIAPHQVTLVFPTVLPEMMRVLCSYARQNSDHSFGAPPPAAPQQQQQQQGARNPSSSSAPASAAALPSGASSAVDIEVTMEVLKIIDFATALIPSEFQVFRWAFLDDDRAMDERTVRAEMALKAHAHPLVFDTRREKEGGGGPLSLFGGGNSNHSAGAPKSLVASPSLYEQFVSGARVEGHAFVPLVRSLTVDPRLPAEVPLTDLRREAPPVHLMREGIARGADAYAAQHSHSTLGALAHGAAAAAAANAAAQRFCGGGVGHNNHPLGSAAVAAALGGGGGSAASIGIGIGGGSSTGSGGATFGATAGSAGVAGSGGYTYAHVGSRGFGNGIAGAAPSPYSLSTQCYNACVHVHGGGYPFAAAAATPHEAAAANAAAAVAAHPFRSLRRPLLAMPDRAIEVLKGVEAVAAGMSVLSGSTRTVEAAVAPQEWLAKEQIAYSNNGASAAAAAAAMPLLGTTDDALFGSPITFGAAAAEHLHMHQQALSAAAAAAGAAAPSGGRRGGGLAPSASASSLAGHYTMYGGGNLAGTVANGAPPTGRATNNISSVGGNSSSHLSPYAFGGLSGHAAYAQLLIAEQRRLEESVAAAADFGACEDESNANVGANNNSSNSSGLSYRSPASILASTAGYASIAYLPPGASSCGDAVDAAYVQWALEGDFAHVRLAAAEQRAATVRGQRAHLIAARQRWAQRSAYAAECGRLLAPNSGSNGSEGESVSPAANNAAADGTGNVSAADSPAKQQPLSTVVGAGTGRMPPTAAITNAAAAVASQQLPLPADEAEAEDECRDDDAIAATDNANEAAVPTQADDDDEFPELNRLSSPVIAVPQEEKRNEDDDEDDNNDDDDDDSDHDGTNSEFGNNSQNGEGITVAEEAEGAFSVPTTVDPTDDAGASASADVSSYAAADASVSGVTAAADADATGVPAADDEASTAAENPALLSVREDTAQFHSDSNANATATAAAEVHAVDANEAISADRLATQRW